MITRFVREIDELRPEQLDRFRDILLSQGFLKYVELETSGRLEPCHFAGFDGEELVAFAPAFLQRKAVTYDVSELFSGRLGRLMRQVGVGPERILCVHTPFRLAAPIGVVEPGTQGRFIAELTREARDIGCRGVVVPSVPASATELDRVLRDAGFTKMFHDIDFFLDVSYPDFEAFLASLSSPQRGNFRRDGRELAKAGVTVSRCSRATPVAQRLFDLHAGLMDKYGHQEAELSAESFARIERCIERSSFLVAERNDELIGFSWAIYDDTTYHGLRCGQDYSASQGARVYLNLVFNAAVCDAIELGCHRIHYGKGSHRTKLYRGCRPESVYVYLRLFNPLWNMAYRGKLERYGQTLERAALQELTALSPRS